jgi:general secretion pathway protein L
MNTIRSSPPASERLGVFLRWWRGELFRMLPERFALLRGGGSTPLVMIEGNEAVAIDTHAAAGAGEKRASLAALEPAQRRATLRNLLESLGETRGRARAALRNDDALVRRVTLPAATEENLAHVVGFEMDRLSPFSADEVYFDQRVVSRDSVAGQIVVELAIARREAVDARVRELRELGVSVQGVALREDAMRSPMPFDLLPSEQRGERETPRERLVRHALIGAVALLFIAALVFPVWQKREAVVALLPAVEKARQEAQATDAVVRDLERQAADYNYLLGRQHAWYPVAAYVEEISRLLPDNTWLQQLDLKTAGKTKEVVITGETASSSKLIELLEQSKLLRNASPRGPTTRGSTPGSERFMIGAELRARTPPEPQPLSAAAQPAAPAPGPFGPAATPVPFGPAPKANPPPAASSAFGPAPKPAPNPPTATVTPVPAPAAAPAPPPSPTGFGPPPRR